MIFIAPPMNKLIKTILSTVVFVLMVCLQSSSSSGDTRILQTHTSYSAVNDSDQFEDSNYNNSAGFDVDHGQGAGSGSGMEDNFPTDDEDYVKVNNATSNSTDKNRAIHNATSNFKQFNTSICEAFICLAGGECLEQPVAEPYCQCPSGRLGRHCETGSFRRSVADVDSILLPLVVSLSIGAVMAVVVALSLCYVLRKKETCLTQCTKCFVKETWNMEPSRPAFPPFPVVESDKQVESQYESMTCTSGNMYMEMRVGVEESRQRSENEAVYMTVNEVGLWALGIKARLQC